MVVMNVHDNNYLGKSGLYSHEHGAIFLQFPEKEADTYGACMETTKGMKFTVKSLGPNKNDKCLLGKKNRPSTLCRRNRLVGRPVAARSGMEKRWLKRGNLLASTSVVCWFRLKDFWVQLSDELVPWVHVDMVDMTTTCDLDEFCSLVLRFLQLIRILWVASTFSADFCFSLSVPWVSNCESLKTQSFSSFLLLC